MFGARWVQQDTSQQPVQFAIAIIHTMEGFNWTCVLIQLSLAVTVWSSPIQARIVRFHLMVMSTIWYNTFQLLPEPQHGIVHTPEKILSSFSMNPYGWNRNWIKPLWIQTRCASIASTCKITLAWKIQWASPALKRMWLFHFICQAQLFVLTLRRQHKKSEIIFLG